MKKSYLVICIGLLVVLILLTGCGKKVVEKGIEKEMGGEADVDIGKDKVTVETEEGTVEVTGTDNDEWCQEGAEWTFTSKQPEEQGDARWIIKGLISSGEYAGLCHVEYTFESEGETGKMDYYFSEDGESGYFEIEAGGQKIKQEWSNE
ncbi:hypothetical protein KY348_05240 [Candidatus Woesearchaeota archaeon]|nr:hypothetical protein [Candidatus Woesearchaeota archaeon]